MVFHILSDLLISDNVRVKEDRARESIFWLSVRKNVLFGGFKEAAASKKPTDFLPTLTHTHTHAHLS